MPASGKTSVGRIVAHHLGRPYLDSDELIRERTGMTGAELAQALAADFDGQPVLPGAPFGPGVPAPAWRSCR